MALEQELITAQTLAEALDLSVETVWRYTREQRIPCVTIGNKQYRYRLAEVLAALADRQVREQATGYATAAKRKLTYADYLLLPEEQGCRFEILDGELVRDPSPIVIHQRVSRRLQRMLEDYFATVDSTGEVFNAPLDVTLGEYTVVQPDLFYMAGGQEQMILRARIDGPPRLVVEVMSPATSRKDRLRKRCIYQQAGIQHYWLVSPEERSLECFSLHAGIYAITVSGMDDDLVEPREFPGLSIALSALW